MIYHMQCIVGYIVLSVLSKINVGFERWFGGNISAPKHGYMKQALEGVLEFELFKQDQTTTGTCVINSLYCISNIIRYTPLFCIALTCISSDVANVCFTMHHNSLANAEVLTCILNCRSRIHVPKFFDICFQCAHVINRMIT